MMRSKRVPSLVAVVVLAVLALLSVGSWWVIRGSVERQDRALLREQTAEAVDLLQRNVERTSQLLGSVGVGAAVFDANANALRTRSTRATIGLVTKGRADAEGNVTAGPPRISLAVGPALHPGQRLGGKLRSIALTARSSLSASPVIRLAGTRYVVYSIVPPAIGLPGYVALALMPVFPNRPEATNGPYRHLVVALYASPTPRASQLIASTIGQKPLPRPRTSAELKVGSLGWGVVGAAEAPLLDRGVQATPWVVLGVGLLLALGLAAMVETLVRRQREQQFARRVAERSADAARALTHVREAIFLTDAEGGVRYRNAAAEAWFPVPPDETGADLLRRVLAEFDTPDKRRGPQRVSIDGQDRWLTCAESRFDGGAVFVLRDATDDYRLEALRSDFVTTAAHQLRTPLAAIYGAVRTIRKRPALGDGTRDNLLELIENESERLKTVSDQLLVAAQLDAGTLRVSLQPVEAIALCETLLRAGRVRRPAGVELRLEAPATPIWIEADPERLPQVLDNLLDNAIKYSPDGGVIEIRVSAAGRYGAIEVTDQGIGIPTAEQQRIFDKFYRLDPNMTRGVGGTGLGLHISSELIHQMHGRLAVTSHHGVGSTFTVTLPLATRDGRGHPTERSEDYSLADT